MKNKVITLLIIGVLGLVSIGSVIYASNLRGRLVQIEDEIWEAQAIAVNLIFDYLPADRWRVEDDRRVLLDTTLITWREEDSISGWIQRYDFSGLPPKHLLWSQVVKIFLPNN